MKLLWVGVAIVWVGGLWLGLGLADDSHITETDVWKNIAGVQKELLQKFGVEFDGAWPVTSAIRQVRPHYSEQYDLYPDSLMVKIRRHLACAPDYLPIRENDSHITAGLSMRMQAGSFDTLYADTTDMGQLVWLPLAGLRLQQLRNRISALEQEVRGLRRCTPTPEEMEKLRKASEESAERARESLDDREWPQSPELQRYFDDLSRQSQESIERAFRFLPLALPPDTTRGKEGEER